MSRKTGLSNFAQTKHSLFFHFLYRWTGEIYVMCETLWFVACNNYLNLYYAYSWVYVHSILFMPNCVFLNAWNSMMSVALLICCVWKYRRFRFYKPNVLALVVLLTKSDVPVFQTGLSDFSRQSICFSWFNYCYSLVICITYYLFRHTFVTPLGCIDIGGAP
jgi:hypothetical protein